MIETTAAAMRRIMQRHEGIGTLCSRGWITLAVIDPQTREIEVYRDGAFRPYSPESRVLPRTASSVDWCCGWRDRLEFAEIGAAPPGYDDGA